MVTAAGGHPRIAPAQKHSQDGNPVKIIRFSRAVSCGGRTSTMICRSGTEEELRRWAEQIAEENHAEVEAIV